MRIKWICRVRMWKIFSANILSDGSLSCIELHHRIVVYTTFYSTARDSFWLESTKVCAPHQHPAVKVKLSSILDEQKRKVIPKRRERNILNYYLWVWLCWALMFMVVEKGLIMYFISLFIFVASQMHSTLSLTLLGYNHTLCNVTIIINCCQHSIRTCVARCWSVGSL